MWLKWERMFSSCKMQMKTTVIGLILLAGVLLLMVPGVSATPGGQCGGTVDYNCQDSYCYPNGNCWGPDQCTVYTNTNLEPQDYGTRACNHF